jgi:hypothetical protein
MPIITWLEKVILALDVSPMWMLSIFIFVIQMVAVILAGAIFFGWLFRDWIAAAMGETYSEYKRRFKFGYFRHRRLTKGTRIKQR